MGLTTIHPTALRRYWNATAANPNEDLTLGEGLSIAEAPAEREGLERTFEAGEDDVHLHEGRILHSPHTREMQEIPMSGIEAHQ